MEPWPDERDSDRSPFPIATSMTLPGGRRNLAKSATRALDLLEHFASVRRPLRATEIAHEFGWRSSSADQLLKTLVDSGYLIFDKAKKLYRPSPRLVRFGAWLSADYYGGDRLYRLLGLVHGRSGEVVTLAVRQGTTMQIVDLLQPAFSPQVPAKGLTVPLIGSVIGSAYLAARSDHEVRTIVELIDARRAGGPRTQAVLDLLQSVRSRGYASGQASDGMMMTGDGDDAAWPIAIGLPPCEAGVGLVLGLSGTRDRIAPKEAEYAGLLKACVSEVLST